jgi:hypothetical protein
MKSEGDMILSQFRKAVKNAGTSAFVFHVPCNDNGVRALKAIRHHHADVEINWVKMSIRVNAGLSTETWQETVKQNSAEIPASGIAEISAALDAAEASATITA